MWEHYQNLAKSMSTRTEKLEDGREVVTMQTLNKDTAQSFVKLAKAWVWDNGGKCAVLEFTYQDRLFDSYETEMMFNNMAAGARKMRVYVVKFRYAM